MGKKNPRACHITVKKETASTQIIVYQRLFSLFNCQPRQKNKKKRKERKSLPDFHYLLYVEWLAEVLGKIYFPVVTYLDQALNHCLCGWCLFRWQQLSWTSLPGPSPGSRCVWPVRGCSWIRTQFPLCSADIVIPGSFPAPQTKAEPPVLRELNHKHAGIFTKVVGILTKMSGLSPNPSGFSPNVPQLFRISCTSRGTASVSKAQTSLSLPINISR